MRGASGWWLMMHLAKECYELVTAASLPKQCRPQPFPCCLQGRSLHTLVRNPPGFMANGLSGVPEKPVLASCLPNWPGSPVERKWRHQISWLQYCSQLEETCLLVWSGIQYCRYTATLLRDGAIDTSCPVPSHQVSVSEVWIHIFFFCWATLEGCWAKISSKTEPFLNWVGGFTRKHGRHIRHIEERA